MKNPNFTKYSWAQIFSFINVGLLTFAALCVCCGYLPTGYMAFMFSSTYTFIMALHDGSPMSAAFCAISWIMNWVLLQQHM